MPKAAARQNNIGGYLPTFHHGQSNEIRVLSGKNFRWHYDGPFSGWGSEPSSSVLNLNLNLPYFGLFHFDDKSIITTPEGIFEQVSPCVWSMVYALAPLNLSLADRDYPWSMAFVGDSYFFSHPLIGIVKYNRFTCEWSKVVLACSTDQKDHTVKEAIYYDFSSEECKKDNPVFGITEAGNRLLVLSRDTIGHSAIDDGENLECDPFCAGGFVSSSIAHYGKPLGIFKTLNGFAAFTSNAVVQGREIESMAAFSYKAISYETCPINPHAIVSFGEGFDTLFLSKSGLHIAGLNRETLIIQDFELEIGSWLVEKELIRQEWLQIQHSVKLQYCAETKEVFISLLDPTYERPQNLYSRALVYNVKYKKWSSFDQDHYVLGPVNGLRHRSYGFTLGFLGYDCGLHWFNYKQTVDYIKDKELVSYCLDSYVELGPFTLPLEGDIHGTSEMQAITLFTEGGQRLLDPKFSRAHNTHQEVESYDGLSLIPFSGEVSVSSSNDMYTPLLNQCREAFPISDNLTSEFTHNYTCNTTGIYHSVIVKALGVNEHFAVKRVDVQLRTKGTTA